MSHDSAMSEKYYRRQAMYWLMAAAVVAALWLIIWLTSAAPSIIKAKQADEVQSSDLALPATISDLNELKNEVKPMDNSVLVRDLRSYPPEFKDKIYFNGISGSYAIQLMDVAENEVIVDYLNGRSDRDQFAYFRYTDDNDKQRYVLTYGKFASSAEAEAGLAQVNFGLPSSITPKTAKVSEFLSVIDSYELGQNVVDLASSQPRRVRLQATRTEIPVRAATKADEELARASQERAVQTQISEQVQPVAPADTAPADHPRQPAQPSQAAPSDLPMAPTARPEPAAPKPAAEAPKAEPAQPKPAAETPAAPE
ncbi:hypothetical protein B0681_07340 [Moraxella porci DSM 25326]|uniref:SPOR domain-containing protein n=1 Tax=Moraxella porci DSM 25326 TaxID=573983 RepID=A0A1T0CPY1_9GAMM|nr:hypothetical protein [Moraxella porci]OOS24406.1 hypothetical protein B0681_07340 [Moraxella porci DSM 25326]